MFSRVIIIMFLVFLLPLQSEAAKEFNFNCRTLKMHIFASKFDKKKQSASPGLRAYYDRAARVLVEALEGSSSKADPEAANKMKRMLDIDKIRDDETDAFARLTDEEKKYYLENCQ